MTKHPDADLKVGSTREGAGFTWTLYKNQFGLAWKAGPRAHNIRLAINTPENFMHNSPYMIGGVGYATFEKAAAKAVDMMARDYEKAKAMVAAYEGAQ